MESGIGLPRAIVGGDGDVSDEDDLRGQCGESESGPAGDGGGCTMPGVEHHDPPGDAEERADCGVIVWLAVRQRTVRLRYLHATTPFDICHFLFAILPGARFGWSGNRAPGLIVYSIVPRRGRRGEAEP